MGLSRLLGVFFIFNFNFNFIGFLIVSSIFLLLACEGLTSLLSLFDLWVWPSFLVSGCKLCKEKKEVKVEFKLNPISSKVP